MIDNPAQDFRATAIIPRAEYIYKIDHALSIDPIRLACQLQFRRSA
jgi:hypothetical protein